MTEDKKEPQVNYGTNTWIGKPKEEDKIINVVSKNSVRGDEDTQKTANGNLTKETSSMKQAKQTAQIHMSQIKLTEVTANIFAALGKGNICRYGTTGWILRCPQCAKLIITEDDTHKTYTNRDNTHYRLSPSLVCPHDDCDWHVWGTILPETITEEKTKTMVEENNKNDTEKSTIPETTTTTY